MLLVTTVLMQSIFAPHSPHETYTNTQSRLVLLWLWLMPIRIHPPLQIRSWLFQDYSLQWGWNLSPLEPMRRPRSGQSDSANLCHHFYLCTCWHKWPKDLHIFPLDPVRRGSLCTYNLYTFRGSILTVRTVSAFFLLHSKQPLARWLRRPFLENECFIYTIRFHCLSQCNFG